MLFGGTVGMQKEMEGAPSASRGSDLSLGGNAIAAVAAWCKTMQNGSPIIQGLRHVADAFGADLAVIARVGHGNDESFREKAQVVAFDRRANFSSGVEGFRFSAAEAVCGKYLATCKPGSVWNARSSEIAASPQLAIALRHRQLLELVVIPLEHHANRSDFLELYFPRFETARKIDGFSVIGGTFSEAWKSRQLGLLSNSTLRQRRTGGRGEVGSEADILGVENPFRLSRAEYRVCLLMSAGLNNAALLDELLIGAATLRTHLRNIYAKTNTACQAELVQRLLSGRGRQGTSAAARTNVA